jgi:hypothetical protein
MCMGQPTPQHLGLAAALRSMSAYRRTLTCVVAQCVEQQQQCDAEIHPQQFRCEQIVCIIVHVTISCLQYYSKCRHLSGKNLQIWQGWDPVPRSTDAKATMLSVHMLMLCTMLHSVARLPGPA